MELQTTLQQERFDNHNCGWTPIMSCNSHISGTTVLKYEAPPFEQLKVSDLVRIRVFSKQTPFVFNVIRSKNPTLTRVERVEMIPLILKINEEYEGIVLEKNRFYNEIKDRQEDVIKVMIGVGNDQYFIYINSASCWYGGLIIYQLNSKF